MRKSIIVAALIVSAFTAFTAFAGFPVGSPTYLQCVTNSAVGASGSITVAIPAINVAVSGITNGATQFTNNICGCLTNGTTVYTITASSTFNAGGSTANTNFYVPAQSVTLPCNFFMQFYPQGPSNTCSVQSL